MTAPPQGVEIEHVEYPAGRIRYYRAGSSGPPVVLLHGGGIDNGLLAWRHTIPALAVDHRVHVPDLPGRGGSVEWTGRADQRNLEEVLRWLLDSWGLEEATLVGLSMGGSIATGFALRHPQRVGGLVLAGSGGLQPRVDKQVLLHLLLRTRFAGPLIARLLPLHRGLSRRYLARGAFGDPHSVPDLEHILDEVRAELRTCGSVFTDWMTDAVGRRSMRVNHLPHLGRIHCPTMLIHGERDAMVPVSAAREAAGAIPGSKLRIVPGAGHWVNRERPNEFNAFLREFVNGGH
ncbi:pimeloyl-ACP methyl ester carboxylesterase [Halopolyspora algeriensis]|uniref:Pimeloyl-ACP methyl ester carboxylesterase n=1 Tax=Halopolyspora algeriensis TaxID=1500506 RepID=A0A368VU24_9ACTN|nr:alpha/beta hydrolase [Halopolyspora algeriensis]RCW45255.1 pimeloyl-ACP methyl ester carboxylesterase [Halopolyspora algeriensis]TQM53026.1 pimeloyl-ACP methyl ester carboxylesterase [Halopolyspora algeriensis]